MKTPNGARLSSSFGMRKHPILGYNKMHKFLNFAASGTNNGLEFWNSHRARWCGGGNGV